MEILENYSFRGNVEMYKEMYCIYQGIYSGNGVSCDVVIDQPCVFFHRPLPTQTCHPPEQNMFVNVLWSSTMMSQVKVMPTVTLYSRSLPQGIFFILQVW